MTSYQQGNNNCVIHTIVIITITCSFLTTNGIYNWRKQQVNVLTRKLFFAKKNLFTLYLSQIQQTQLKVLRIFLIYQQTICGAYGLQVQLTKIKHNLIMTIRCSKCQLILILETSILNTKSEIIAQLL